MGILHGRARHVAQLSQQVEWFDFKVFRTTQIFIVVILYGATTDYCLFLISRYAEELKRGLPPREAVEAAIARVGPAITASAMTTILSLGMMIFAQFGKFRYGGPTIALSLLVALAASLTLAPRYCGPPARSSFGLLAWRSTIVRKRRWAIALGAVMGNDWPRCGDPSGTDSCGECADPGVAHLSWALGANQL